METLDFVGSYVARKKPPQICLAQEKRKKKKNVAATVISRNVSPRSFSMKKKMLLAVFVILRSHDLESEESDVSCARENS